MFKEPKERMNDWLANSNKRAELQKVLDNPLIIEAVELILLANQPVCLPTQEATALVNAKNYGIKVGLLSLFDMANEKIVQSSQPKYKQIQ